MHTKDLRNLRRLLRTLPDDEFNLLLASAKPKHAASLREVRCAANGNEAARLLGISYSALRQRLDTWSKSNRNLVDLLHYNPVLVWIYPNGRPDRGPDGAGLVYEEYFNGKPAETVGWTPPDVLKRHWGRQWENHHCQVFNTGYSGPFMIEVDVDLDGLAGDADRRTIALLNGYIYRDSRGSTHIAVWFLVSSPLVALHPDLRVGEIIAHRLQAICSGENTYVYFELGVDHRLSRKCRYFKMLLREKQVGLPVCVPGSALAPYYQPRLAGVPDLEPFALGVAIPRGWVLDRDSYLQLVRQIYAIYRKDTSATDAGVREALKKVEQDLEGDVRLATSWREWPNP